MTFDDAVAYVIREKSIAYSFIPLQKAKRIVGGSIYVIECNEDNETDPQEYGEFSVFYSGGLFRSSSGEEETYMPEEVPEEALSSHYLPADTAALDAKESILEMFLLRLRGMSRAEADKQIDYMSLEQMLTYGS